MLLHRVQLIESVPNHLNLCICMLVFSLDYITLDLQVQDRCYIINRCICNKLAVFLKLLLISFKSFDNTLVILSKLAVMISSLVKKFHKLKIDTYNSTNY